MEPLSQIANSALMEITNGAVNDVRNRLSGHIRKWHKDDDRVILNLNFDGNKINAEWIEREEYLESEKAS